MCAAASQGSVKTAVIFPGIHFCWGKAALNLRFRYIGVKFVSDYISVS